MKIKLLLSILVAALALALPACAPVVKEVPLQATYDDFSKNKNQGREVTIMPGNLLKVTIASNPTTGFKWELGNIGAPEVVGQVGEPEYVPPGSTLAGAGGQEIWTFQALKRGTSSIYLAYSRPWEGGTKAEWSLNINVSVK